MTFARSSEAEVQFEIIKPRDASLYLFLGEFFGQVFIVCAQVFDMRCVVVGDDYCVVVHADVSIQSSEEVLRQMGGIPLGNGQIESLAQLVDGGLCDESMVMCP